MDNQNEVLYVLNKLTARLELSPEASTVHETFQKLDEVWKQLPLEQWRDLATNLVQKHSLSQLLLQDPYTERARRKPRGYAGDAVMLDFVYDGLGDQYKHPGAVTSLGKTIFQETVGSPSGQAVRNRKQILADFVDALAARVPQPTVLSIACGHLREASVSTAFATGKIGQWYALDQDTESLSTLRECYGSDSSVIPIEASIRDLMKGEVALPPADFVYAAGLYDYLDENRATRLLQTLLSLTKPGGQTLIANFASDSMERAYMESVMDWWLTYRSEEDMLRLASALPQDQIDQVTTFRDTTNRIVYLTFTRRKY
jgi:extracellular factor (EF) 3-hydroxypalmitic acid methyl ester biosynthesis protein